METTTKTKAFNQYYDLGKQQASRGLWQKASASYRQAIELQPSNFQLYEHLASALVKQDRLEEGLMVYQRFLELNPHPPAQGREQLFNQYYELGKKQASQGLWQKAIASYRQAIELQPSNFQPYEHLAAALAKQGRIEDGRIVYQRFLELNPHSSEQDIDQPWEQYVKGNLKIAENSQKSASYYISLGNKLKSEEKLSEAIAAYQQALKLEPDNPKVYAFLGTVQKQQGDLSAAVSNLRKAIEINPQPPAWFYRSLGGSLQQQGNNEKAIKAYYKAIKINSNTPFWVYKSLGNILSQKQRWEEAITAYQQAKKLKPNNKEISRKLEQAELKYQEQKG